MNILVFCSARRVPQIYTEAAIDLATRIAEGGHTLVWGGSNVGTMKTVADAAKAAGGKIIGVSIAHFKHIDRLDADEMVATADLSERKKVMLERADAVIALAGGIGTLDEITDVLVLKRIGHHDKPVVFLNTDNFYEGMHIQLQRMDREGFLKGLQGEVVDEALIYFADTPEAAMSHIAEYGSTSRL